MKIKLNHMDKLFISVLFLFIVSSLNCQVTKTDVLQDLEKDRSAGQASAGTAITKSATRLFRDKDDLTSVILVIPKDSVVELLGSDDTFLHVVFEGSEGYIYSRHAEINKDEVINTPAARQSEVQEESPILRGRPVGDQKISRYSYLENKYGQSMAARIYAGKIWKGMNAQMVKDSWGSPKKISRVISGNVVKEEWFYSTTLLYFQNSTLTGWGPVKD
jgi:hypothetical protein